MEKDRRSGWELGDTIDRLLSERGRPGRKVPVVVLDRVSTDRTAWLRVIEWVPRRPGGVLKEISITSDLNARYKLTVEGEEMFTDKRLPSNLALDFHRMEVLAGRPNRIEVRSATSGTTVTVDAVIHGEQKLASGRAGTWPERS